MENQPLVQALTRSLVHLSSKEKQIRDFLEAHRSTEATRRARATDFADFTSWASSEGIELSFPFPLQVVEKYALSLLTRYKVTTVERRIATLSSMHTEAQRHGLSVENPCAHVIIKDILKNARKAQARKVNKRKQAITYNVLAQMIATCDKSLLGLRDRAVLMFAFASGGRRRSEVASARTEYLETVGEDFRYYIAKSKTDQAGEGQYVPITGTAAAALKEWMKAAQIFSEGPLFRGLDRHGNISHSLTCKTIARIVKARLLKAGLDSDLYSAHSLRSGFVTEAATRGAAEAAIMAMTGHKSQTMVKRYYRAGDIMNNPAARLCG